MTPLSGGGSAADEYSSKDKHERTAHRLKSRKVHVGPGNLVKRRGKRDRLLLMRDGELLADETLEGLLAPTGAPDVESAFLALVEAGPMQRRSAPRDLPSTEPEARL